MFLNFLFSVIILCFISIAECSSHVSCDTTNPNEIYKCDNGYCTYRSWICDRHNDCGDNSDEKSCHSANPCLSNPHLYQCFESTKCIQLESLCNNKLDCPFGDDEGLMCQKFRNSCISLNCSHGCMITPMGPMCRCPFPLSRTFDNMTCGTWDSSKICISSENQTNLKCSCQFGYRQTSNESCESFPIKPILFYAGKIREIIRNPAAISIKYIKTDENARVLSMAFDRKSGTIFISGTKLYSSKPNFISAVKESTEKAQKLPLLGIIRPTSLIYDEVRDTLIVLDTVKDKIFAYDPIQLKCSPIIGGDIHVQSSIALDQKNGIIFWTEFEDSTIVKSANLDGSANSETAQIEVSIIIKNIFFNENDRNLYFISDSENGTVGVLFSNHSYKLFTQNKFSHGKIIGNFFNSLLIYHFFGVSVFDTESMVLSSDIIEVKLSIFPYDSVFGIYQPRPAYLSKLKNLGHIITETISEDFDPNTQPNPVSEITEPANEKVETISEKFDPNTQPNPVSEITEPANEKVETISEKFDPNTQPNPVSEITEPANEKVETISEKFDPNTQPNPVSEITEPANEKVETISEKFDPNTQPNPVSEITEPANEKVETISEKFDPNTQPNPVSEITEPTNEKDETWLKNSQANDKLNETMTCDNKLNQAPYKYLFIILILCVLNLVVAILHSVTKIIIYRKNRHTRANSLKFSLETWN